MNLPKTPGIYQNIETDPKGHTTKRTLFVGFVNHLFPKNQGYYKYYPCQKLQCCPLEENLHADRLQPKEYPGDWEKIGGEFYRLPYKGKTEDLLIQTTGEKKQGQDLCKHLKSGEKILIALDACTKLDETQIYLTLNLSFLKKLPK